MGTAGEVTRCPLIDFLMAEALWSHLSATKITKIESRLYLKLWPIALCTLDGASTLTPYICFLEPVSKLKSQEKNKGRILSKNVWYIVRFDYIFFYFHTFLFENQYIWGDFKIWQAVWYFFLQIDKLFCELNLLQWESLYENILKH